MNGPVPSAAVKYLPPTKKYPWLSTSIACLLGSWRPSIKWLLSCARNWAAPLSSSAAATPIKWRPGLIVFIG